RLRRPVPLQSEPGGGGRRRGAQPLHRRDGRRRHAPPRRPERGRGASRRTLGGAMISRIVVVNDSTLAKGGATGLALASATAFRDLGFEVTFLAGDAGDNPELTRRGIEVVALGRDRLMASPLRQTLLGALYNRDARRMVSDWI